MTDKKFNWEILSLTRFLLASIVMVGHLMHYIQIGFLKWFTYLGSFEAIFGFLVISGLSIGKSIIRNKESYFERRVKRIYPIYLASIVLAYFVSVYPNPITLSYAGYIVLNLVFLNQVFTATSFVGPSWTLAVEVWLYALAPVFLKLNLRSLFALIYISFACFCLYTCGCTLYHWVYYSSTKFGINLIFLAFIWLLGFALAKFPESKKFVSINIAVIFALYILLTLLIQLGFRYKHHELGLFISTDSLFFIGHSICLCLVYYVVIFNDKIPFFSVSVHKIFNLLGNISYPLYLIHTTIFELMLKWNIHNLFLLICGAIMSSFIVYWVFDFYSKKRVAKY